MEKYALKQIEVKDEVTGVVQVLIEPAIKTPANFDARFYPGADFTPANADDPDDPCVSRTDPQYELESDPNTIVARFLKTGDLNELIQNRRETITGDFSMVHDYFSAMCLVREVELAFGAFPYKTREMFDHDPQKMLDFIADPKNEEKCIELKLYSRERIAEIKKAKAEAEAEAAAVAAAAAKAEAAKGGAAKPTA